MESAQKVWLGHTLRHSDLVPIVIEGRIKEKGPPGRPRAGMLDRVIQEKRGTALGDPG